MLSSLKRQELPKSLKTKSDDQDIWSVFQIRAPFNQNQLLSGHLRKPRDVDTAESSLMHNIPMKDNTKNPWSRRPCSWYCGSTGKPIWSSQMSNPVPSKHKSKSTPIWKPATCRRWQLQRGETKSVLNMMHMSSKTTRHRALILHFLAPHNPEKTSASILFLGILVCDVEVPQFVHIPVLVGCNHPEPVPHIVLLQVLLRQIFQVPASSTPEMVRHEKYETSLDIGTLTFLWHRFLTIDPESRGRYRGDP